MTSLTKIRIMNYLRPAVGYIPEIAEPETRVACC